MNGKLSIFSSMPKLKQGVKTSEGGKKLLIQKIWILSFLSITKSLEKDWNSFLYVYLNTNNIHLNFMWEINFFWKISNFLKKIFFEKSWDSSRCIFMSFEVTAMILLWKEREWAIFFRSKVFYPPTSFLPPFF